MAKGRVVYKTPDADFGSRALDVARTGVPRVWYRVAKSRYGPVYFNRSGELRFDSPTATHGVCYLASTIPCALAEVYGEDVIRRPNPRVSLRDFEARNLYRCRIPVEANAFCELYGPNLLKLGADMTCFVGKKGTSQEWARALMLHPLEFDGLLYIARQGGEKCLALFDRASSALDFEDLGKLSENVECLEFMVGHGACLY